MMGPGCWWGWPGHFFGGPFGMIVGILFWAAVLYGIFILISRLARGTGISGGKDETPTEILKKRYARGEIDAEEFARRKKDLES
ncbi:MAG: SHOCT domain-containing protein [Nitrospiraceae bacterium]|nr:SHOCT domain-containing protein [Nitrospiraceae bacterium]